jgi:NADH-quinone oxidoreductase subunit N
VTGPIPLPVLEWGALLPILLVTGTVIVCLLLDVAPGAGGKGVVAAVGILGLGGALLLSVLAWEAPALGFQDMVALDRFTLFFNAVFCVTTALVLALSVGYVRRQGIEVGEYYALVLLAAVGMMLMAAARDLLIVFLGLELMSISLYVLTGFFRTRPAGNEAALKYLLLGAFASGFFLYGIALLYGATGTTNLARLGAALAAPGGGPNALVVAGFALLLVGFGFKASAVPFHQWAPDVYEGAPTPVAALIATGSKAAALAALLRVLVAMPGLEADWAPAFWLGAALTMTVGNVAALVQGNVKRLLAYSSVAHVGYMLVGLAAGLGPGAPAVVFYLAVYGIASVGAFGVVLVLERGRRDEVVEIDGYAGLAARHPVLALVLTVCLLSLVGMPPTAGFVGKVYLFSAAVREGLIGLAVIAVLNSVVATYYYLRLIVAMYMREPDAAAARPALTPAAGVALAVTAWLTLHLGVLPGPVLALAQRAVAPLVP